MSHARDCETGSHFDKWAYIGPKRRKFLEDSWAVLSRKEILQELPIEKMAPPFHEIFGRPTKEMHTTLRILIFQQMFDTSRRGDGGATGLQHPVALRVGP